MKIEMNMPDLPDGYEYTGEYRNVQLGELFYNSSKKTVEEWVGGCSSISLFCVVKKKRWRAEDGGSYFFISVMGEALRVTEYLTEHSNNLWKTGNYFKTEEQAEHAAKKIKKLLMELHNV